MIGGERFVRLFFPVGLMDWAYFQRAIKLLPVPLLIFLKELFSAQRTVAFSERRVCECGGEK